MQMRQIVSDHDGYVAAANLDDLVSAARDDESHLAARRHITLLYGVDDTSVTQDGGGAHRAAVRQQRRSYDSRYPAAILCDTLEGLFAERQKRRFAQKIVCRGAADGILGEQDKIGILLLGLLDGIDYLGGIAFDIADSIV